MLDHLRLSTQGMTMRPTLLLVPTYSLQVSFLPVFLPVLPGLNPVFNKILQSSSTPLHSRQPPLPLFYTPLHLFSPCCTSIRPRTCYAHLPPDVIQHEPCWAVSPIGESSRILFPHFPFLISPLWMVLPVMYILCIPG